MSITCLFCGTTSDMTAAASAPSAHASSKMMTAVAGHPASCYAFQRPENGPCFAFRPSDFPCAYAGSDGCPVFKRKTSPVKLCGVYTGAAVRGCLVALEEVHLAAIQAQTPEIVHLEGRVRQFPWQVCSK